MTAYTKDELMSSSKVVRNFSSILDSIKNKEKAKIAVMRKNKLEAVILSIDEYEKIHEIMDLFEHFQNKKFIEQNSNSSKFYYSLDLIPTFEVNYSRICQYPLLSEPSLVNWLLSFKKKTARYLIYLPWEYNQKMI